MFDIIFEQKFDLNVRRFGYGLLFFFAVKVIKPAKGGSSGGRLIEY